MPSARNVIPNASVPVPTPMAAAAPLATANSFSNASSSGPRTNRPRATTRSIAARIAGASSPGVSCRKGITGICEGSRSYVIPAVRRQWPRRRNRARAMSQMFLADHERDPQRCHVDRRLEEATEVEELRFAIHAMIVVNRHFRDGEARVLDFLHHLEADDATASFQRHAVEYRSPHQAEIAVHIPHAQSKQQLDGVVVHAADENTMPRIGSTDLVSIHQIDVASQGAPEDDHLRRIVLRIAIGVEDQFPCGRGKATAQSGSVTTVSRVVDDFDFRVGARELVDNAG